MGQEGKMTPLRLSVFANTFMLNTLLPSNNNMARGSDDIIFVYLMQVCHPYVYVYAVALAVYMYYMSCPTPCLSYWQKPCLLSMVQEGHLGDCCASETDICHTQSVRYCRWQCRLSADQATAVAHVTAVPIALLASCC